MTGNSYSAALDHKESKRMKNGNVSGGIYFLAFIGSVIYYLVHAASFWAGVLGIIKSLFWPAFLIYNLMEFLKM